MSLFSISYAMFYTLILVVLVFPSASPNLSSRDIPRLSRTTNLGLPQRGLLSPGLARRNRNPSVRDGTYIAPLFGRSSAPSPISSSLTRHNTRSSSFTRHNTRALPKFYSSTPNHLRFPLQDDSSSSKSFKSFLAERSRSSFPPSARTISRGARSSSSKSSLSRLDAMLTRLENTNEDLLQELRHERDGVAESVQHHHHQVHQHSRNRHRNSEKQKGRHQNNNNNNNNNKPFNFAGTGNTITNHRTTPTTNNNSMTRIEEPPGMQAPPSGTSSNSNPSRTPGSSAKVLSKPLVEEDEVLDGDEDVTVVEEADYQDEQAARVRSSSSAQQQHHLRERDAQSLRLASENVRYVMTNAQCSEPVRRCIDLSYNQTVKKYWPRCAIVSQCGEESGCCYAPNHICTMSQWHSIDLYFFYMTIEANSRAGVDRLEFQNHTKCECRPRPAPTFPVSSVLSNDQPSSARDRYNYNFNTIQGNTNTRNNINTISRTKGFSSTDSNHHKPQPLHPHDDTPVKDDSDNTEQRVQTQSQNSRSKSRGAEDTNDRKSLTDDVTSEENSIVPCRCPDVYLPSTSPSGACQCKCDEKTGHCRRLMKGKRYFKSKDEKCIMSGECTLPSCKFGTFLTAHQRCPRKREAKRSRNRA